MTQIVFLKVSFREFRRQCSIVCTLKFDEQKITGNYIFEVASRNPTAIFLWKNYYMHEVPWKWNIRILRLLEILYIKNILKIEQ